MKEALKRWSRCICLGRKILLISRWPSHHWLLLLLFRSTATRLRRLTSSLRFLWKWLISRSVTWETWVTHLHLLSLFHQQIMFEVQNVVQVMICCQSSWYFANNWWRFFSCMLLCFLWDVLSVAGMQLSFCLWSVTVGYLSRDIH